MQHGQGCRTEVCLRCEQIQREELQRGAGLEEGLPLLDGIQGYRKRHFVLSGSHQACSFLGRELQKRQAEWLHQLQLYHSAQTASVSSLMQPQHQSACATRQTDPWTSPHRNMG